ncbi:hypothetical protein D9758_012796 [Tetrapyrgos nigripes]|uniref:Cytochrome P450 n=1 Tax=Tetrapyrgos nigripes TaxID=182062 RepID=A0A8H5D063_9AGAR|nr:hypothetical protein D9758_012796 [Tetrapyrgos nigripes]
MDALISEAAVRLLWTRIPAAGVYYLGPPMATAVIVLAALFLAIALGFIYYVILRAPWRTQRRSLSLPPGPRGNRFSGIPNEVLNIQPWRKYAEWAEEFQSPVIHLRTFNRTIIVLNSSTSIKDLLVKRASIYSDRPFSWMYYDICGRGKTVFNISSMDKRHGVYRKVLDRGINRRGNVPGDVGKGGSEGGSGSYWGLLEEEVEVLVDRIMKDPEGYEKHFRHNSASVIMKLAYGYSIKENDPFLKLAEESARISGWALAPGKWLVDYYPILRFLPTWLPGPLTEFKRLGQHWKQRMDLFSDVPHEWVKGQMASGSYIESFTSRLLRDIQEKSASHPQPGHREEDRITEDIIKWCAVGLHAGAADTTVCALTSFILLMALHPQVKKRVQAEIDEIEFIGEGELPRVRIRDLPKLKYLKAVMKEVLRYAPIGNLVCELNGSLALPHKVIQEDVYMGYRIPKDATVLANVWAIMHDPTLYPDPFTFNPDRFFNLGVDSPKSEDALLSDPYTTTKPVQQVNPDPRNFAFGFGKRVCPGIQFAETSLLLCMASILSRMDISLPVASKDIHQVPKIDFTTGLTSHIKPFPIEIQRRR